MSLPFHNPFARCRRIFYAITLFSLICCSGCSLMIARTTSQMMDNLSNAIVNNNDLEMVETGAPAYLLMIDSLLQSHPEDTKLLINAALLYAAYSDMFVNDIPRARKLADKSLRYALKSVCLENPNACDLKNMAFTEFERLIRATPPSDIPALFALGNSWAGWIRANFDDFNAIADISRIEVIMQHIADLDENYHDGAAFLYLGTLASLLPPALGGKPEAARDFFEKALALSRNKNLMVKVTYARQYARMIFDKALHDRLLNEVLETDPKIQGYTLINTLAQKQARELLKSGEDYF